MLMRWLLRGFAVLLALGAAAAAFIGYQLSEQQVLPPPVEVATIQPVVRVPVIRAARALPATQNLVLDDLEVVELDGLPAGGFSNPAQLVGRAPLMDIASGELLTHQHFQSASSPLRGSLRAGERAVGIKVDEVAGLAGFAKPGDSVDVLLYLRAATETDAVSSAQTVLKNVRLLAYGQIIEAGLDEEETEPEEESSLVSRVGSKVKESPPPAAAQQQRHSSAVLAVPEVEVTKLMLAANSGHLRLALRPFRSELLEQEKLAAAEDKVSAESKEDENESALISLAELAQVKKKKEAARKEAVQKPPATSTIRIHEGDTVKNVVIPSH